MGMSILAEVDAILRGENIGVAPPGKLTVMVGDTVRVTLRVQYRGEAISGKCHVTFGQQNAFFNEDGNKQKDISVSFGPDMDWETYTLTTDIYIGGATGTNYDLYAKLMELPGVTDIFTPTYLNVLDVVGAPEFKEFKITDYSKV
ncbi:hypothetical protein ES703_42414 [subsurface metagenome]